jgi:glycosyltransferase involved in cell wall biosynthesis
MHFMRIPARTKRRNPSVKLLVITNMYPSASRPSFGTFVKRQVDALSLAGCDQDLMIIESWRSRQEYLRAIFEVRRGVRSNHYDLVHAYYGLCGFVAAFQAKVPLVVTYCGSDLNPGFAGHAKAPLKSRVIVALGQLASLRACECIVQSREMFERLLWSRARQRTRILTCGVDLDLFKPGAREEARTRLGWSSSERVILFVCSESGLPAVKRPELAKLVVAKVQEKLPGSRLEIVSGRPQQQLPDYYRAADVLLLTSASEGSPNVVKEALACNLPVVSTCVGDVPELVNGLETCRLCNADADSIAAGVLEVLNRGARSDSHELMRRYSMEHTSSALLDLYGKICSSHAHPGASLSPEECSHP